MHIHTQVSGIVITLNVTKADGEAGQLWDLSEDFFRDKVDPTMLRAQIYFPLEPRRANLQTTELPIR